MSHVARIVHRTGGRVRLKLPAAKNNHRVLQDIKQLLKPMSGVQMVEVNTRTGSVLIHYDSKKWQDPATTLKEAGDQSGIFTMELPPEVQELRTLQQDVELLAQHSQLARSIVDFVKQLNLRVKQGTNNTVDLNVLAPLGLALYSLMEVESEAVTPLWLTLGIFSFHSFVALHTSTTANAKGT